MKLYNHRINIWSYINAHNVLCNSLQIHLRAFNAWLFCEWHLIAMWAVFRSDSGHPMQSVRRPQLGETLWCLRL